MRLDQLSRELGVDPATLDNMIQHWVRKGRLRVVEGGTGAGANACSKCGIKGACPFPVKIPRTYELVSIDQQGEMTGPRCGCAHN